VFVAMNVFGRWGSYTFAETLKRDLLVSGQQHASVVPYTLAV